MRRTRYIAALLSALVLSGRALAISSTPTRPGGSSGQWQYNDSGRFGGKTGNADNGPVIVDPVTHKVPASLIPSGADTWDSTTRTVVEIESTDSDPFILSTSAAYNVKNTFGDDHTLRLPTLDSNTPQRQYDICHTGVSGTSVFFSAPQSGAINNVNPITNPGECVEVFGNIRIVGGNPTPVWEELYRMKSNYPVSVPYSGADNDVDLNGHGLTSSFLHTAALLIHDAWGSANNLVGPFALVLQNDSWKYVAIDIMGNTGSAPFELGSMVFDDGGVTFYAPNRAPYLASQGHIRFDYAHDNRIQGSEGENFVIQPDNEAETDPFNSCDVFRYLGFGINLWEHYGQRYFMDGVHLNYLGDGILTQEGGVISTATAPGSVGSFTNANITVDQYGRVVNASNGSGGGGSSIVPIVDQFRVGLASTTAASSTDTVGGTVFLVPVLAGQQITLPDGFGGVFIATTSVLSKSLSGLSADSVYDLYINKDLTIGFSAAYSSWTVRTDALSDGPGFRMVDGGRLIATIRTTAAGTTARTTGQRYIWNETNRVKVPLLASTTVDTWAYLGTWHQSNGVAARRIATVSGDAAFIDITNNGMVSGNDDWGAVGVGIDRDNGNDANAVTASNGSGAAQPGSVQARLTTTVSAGFHRFDWIERMEGDNSLGTAQFFGHNTVQDPNATYTCGMSGWWED